MPDPGGPARSPDRTSKALDDRAGPGRRRRPEDDAVRPDESAARQGSIE